MGNCLHKKTAEAKDPAKTVQPNYEKTFPEVIKKDSIVRNSCIEPNILKEKLSKNQGSDCPRIPEHEPIQIAKRRDTVIRSYGLNNFPYSVLKTATQKFSKSNIIGSGGFGDVYKAWIDPITMNAAKPGSGRIIAVKKLRKAGDQGHDEWQNEADFLRQFHHPNIVKLIGYCSDGKERILVYEHMARGNLEAYLIRECGYGLTWARRLKIAIGAARGLAYLHNSRKPVIHRDFKASNILLDMDLNPKLSDFGLAKYGPQGDKSHISTRILGTRGYFAPEYVATGHLTIRTDIYSFGVVLLEIFCGCGAIRKHTDGMAGDLAVWAKPYLSNRLQLSHVIDKKLRKHLCLEQACEFANIILQCLDHDAKKRPTMNQVVISLEELYIACSRKQALDECNSFTL